MTTAGLVQVPTELQKAVGNNEFFYFRDSKHTLNDKLVLVDESSPLVSWCHLDYAHLLSMSVLPFMFFQFLVK